MIFPICVLVKMVLEKITRRNAPFAIKVVRHVTILVLNLVLLVKYLVPLGIIYIIKKDLTSHNQIKCAPAGMDILMKDLTFVVSACRLAQHARVIPIAHPALKDII